MLQLYHMAFVIRENAVYFTSFNLSKNDLLNKKQTWKFYQKIE